MVIKGEEYDETSLDGIWISDKFASKNKIKLGDELSFTYKSITVSGKVKGLVKSGEYMINIKDEAQLMPDYSKHGFAYVSPALYQALWRALVVSNALKYRLKFIKFNYFVVK